MNRYVIDASVAVKWVIHEIYQESTLRYLEPTFTLMAPSLFLVECASAIQNHVRMGKISKEDGWQAFAAIRHYRPLTLTPSNDLIGRAYVLANELNHALYDCLYLVLAEKQKAVLVTADRKFFERVKVSNYEFLITWVEEPPQEPYRV